MTWWFDITDLDDADGRGGTDTFCDGSVATDNSYSPRTHIQSDHHREQSDVVVS